jgi:hypothetical protein
MNTNGSENFFSGYEDERQALVSWLLINFPYRERQRVVNIFFENFDLAFKDALKNIHGKSVLIFVVQVILAEPSLEDLPEYGYNSQQIDEWASLRRDGIKSKLAHTSNRRSRFTVGKSAHHPIEIIS